MPRPKKEGAVPKTRSRHGCWPCKAKKVKCDETKPSCEACLRANEQCDYKIRLNWTGRGKKAGEGSPWSSEHITVGTSTPRAYTPHAAQKSPPARMSSQSPGSLQQRLASPPFAPPQSSSPSASHLQWPMNFDPTMQGTKRKRDTPESESVSSRLDDATRQDRTLPRPIPQTVFRSPWNGNIPLPATPSTPGQSVGSEDSRLAPLSTSGVQQKLPQDARRLSVQYLLQSPPETENSISALSSDDQTGSISYGFDQGLPDLDIPSNDDANALLLQSPSSATKRLSLVGDEFLVDASRADGFGFGINPKDPKFQRVEYYARPVPVQIPRSLEPLPYMLRQNPMNLLYFHHFLNHTARIMVPHDCPENPFKNVLPESKLT